MDVLIHNDSIDLLTDKEHRSENVVMYNGADNSKVANFENHSANVKWPVLGDNDNHINKD